MNVDMMSSVSFDGTLRKWNTKSMQMEGIYKDKPAGSKSEVSEIQTLAWC